MAKQGFNYEGGNPYVYQQCDTGPKSSAIGIDNTNGLFKIKVLATAGATPTGTAHITIDPAAAGNITLTPNGAGSVVLSPLGVGVVLSNSAGVLSSTGASTAGWVLTANGGVLAPSFQAPAASGIVTLAGDSGTATGATVTIAGTANQIVTSAAAAQVTVALTSSVKIANNLELTDGAATIKNAAVSTASPTIYLEKNRALAALASGDLTGTIKFSGYDGTQYTDSARITSTSSGTIANTRVAGDLKFYTHPDSAAADPTLRMTINPNGSIIVSDAYNTAGTPSGTTKTMLVDSNGLLYGLAGSANTVFVGGTAPSFTATPQCTDLTLTGVLKLPTSSSTVGQIQINSVPYFHNFSPAGIALDQNNICIGPHSGNFSGMTSNTGCNYSLGGQNFAHLTGSYYNIALGFRSLKWMTGAQQNTAVGAVSCLESLGTGNYNTAIGAGSLWQVDSGSGNTAIGLSNESIGSGREHTGSDSWNIDIGHAGVAGESNKMRLGTQIVAGIGINSTYIAGVYSAAATPSGTAKVALVDNAHLVYGLAGSANTVFVGGTAPSFTATPTVTTMYATTFDTNVAAAKLQLAGTTITATGSNTDVGLTVTPKGAGGVTITSGPLAITTSDLHVYQGSALVYDQTASTTPPTYVMVKNRSGGAITSGDGLGYIDFRGHDGTQYTAGASIRSTSSGTIASTRCAGDLKMYTHPDSAAASPTLRMTIASTGAVTIATPDSGTALTVGGNVNASGLSFDSGTSVMSAYTLYDVASFTPTITFGGGNTGITYSSQSCAYSRIGNICFFQLAIVLSNKGSSTGNLQVNLPLTPAAATRCNVLASVVTYTGESMQGQISTSGYFTIGFSDNAGGAFTTMTNTHCANTTNIRAFGFYWV